MIRPVSAHRRRRTGWTTLANLVATVILAAGCGTDTVEAVGDSGGTPLVVVTTGIWADVVTNVACGGEIAVETVIPLGGDPHGFEPSLADRGLLEKAALVVANGLLLEEGLKDTLDAVASRGVPVFEVGAHIDTIEYTAGEHSDGDQPRSEDDDHGRDGADPHVWLDPVRVSAVLPELGDQLANHANLDREAIARCVSSYQARLKDLDADIADMVAKIPPGRRRLVTSHDALGYFADRYRFDIVGTVIPAPSGLAETNPAQLEALAEVIEQTGVPAIFAETQHSDDDVRALADRVGEVEVVALFTGSLGEAGTGADSYLGLVRTNATLITEALG